MKKAPSDYTIDQAYNDILYTANILADLINGVLALEELTIKGIVASLDIAEERDRILYRFLFKRILKESNLAKRLKPSDLIKEIDAVKEQLEGMKAYVSSLRFAPSDKTKGAKKDKYIEYGTDEESCNEK